MSLEDIKVTLGLTITLSLFAFFGFLPSIIYLARGIFPSFFEKEGSTPPEEHH